MATIQPPYGDAEKKLGAYNAPLKVSAQDTPNMTVKVQAGSYFNGLNVFTEFPGGTSPAMTAPVSGAKWTVVTVGNAGTIHTFDGTPGATPDFPTIPAGELPLAAVYILSTSTAVTSSMIADVRPFLRTIDVVPNLTTVISNFTTPTDVQGMIATKADVDGTTGSSFAINKNSVTDQTYATILAKRPTATDVGIRWNEVAAQWEFTNNGTVWNAFISGAVPPVLAATSTNAAFYIPIAAGATGSQALYSDTGLTFNPSTNTLTTTTFVGALTGNAATATTATNASNVTVSSTVTNATFYPAFVSATTGNLAVDVATGFTFNPSTGTLTATSFSGQFLGTSTSTHTVLDAAQANITSLGTLTGLTSSGQITSTVTTGTAPFVVASTTPVANLSIGGNAATATSATSATTATTATNIAGGTAGQVPFQSAAGTTVFDATTDMVYTAGTNTFFVTNYTGTTLTLTGSESSVWKIVPATGRAVNTTAAAATATVAANLSSTFIATPAAAINVTLAAPSGDGERRRIVFGAATTVTWTVTAPATATAMKTSFAAGEAIEIYYNSVAGTPANSAATTWYPY